MSSQRQKLLLQKTDTNSRLARLVIFPEHIAIDLGQSLKTLSLCHERPSPESPFAASLDGFDEAIHDWISDLLIAPGPSLDASLAIVFRGSVKKYSRSNTTFLASGDSC